ncbi:hypothetical protein ACFP4H_22835 [Pseudophaeobacter arcticus]|uniref:hypothetical protein n=1 Tax=Pseudophaeobacter arcticus TaxID=385492 RepID=UPI000406C642|nr:hypothetical protein [Pseudophaeobacter arcticus]
MAEPISVDGSVAYTETIAHPAFGTAVQNSGVFVLTRDKFLLRRQTMPKAEEMMIGPKTITIQRDGTEITRAIPKRMNGFFTVLQAAVFNQGISELPPLPHRITSTTTGWTARISLRQSGGGSIVFSGCGEVLQAIDLEMAGNQNRQIRFLSQ